MASQEITSHIDRWPEITRRLKTHQLTLPSSKPSQGGLRRANTRTFFFLSEHIPLTLTDPSIYWLLSVFCEWRAFAALVNDCVIWAAVLTLFLRSHLAALEVFSRADVWFMEPLFSVWNCRSTCQDRSAWCERERDLPVSLTKLTLSEENGSRVLIIVLLCAEKTSFWQVRRCTNIFI